MKTLLLIPAVGAILALAACSDSEPVQSPSTSKSEQAAPAASTTPSTATANELPAQRGSQATVAGSAKTNPGPAADNAAMPGGAPMPNSTVLRGDQAVTAGSAKANPATTTSATGDLPAGGTVTSNDPPVLRGEQAEVVGQAKAAAPTAGTVDAVAPATTGNAAETKLIPPRDAATTADAQAHPADDSGRNKREDGTLPTSLDQGTSDADLKITQGIRSTVVGRDDLSTNAKNAKIITRDGVVTLRGPVANAQERDALASIAKAQMGVTRIDNHLEPLQQ